MTTESLPHGDVAQRLRVPVCRTGSRGFKSRHPRRSVVAVAGVSQEPASHELVICLKGVSETARRHRFSTLQVAERLRRWPAKPITWV